MPSSFEDRWADTRKAIEAVDTNSVGQSKTNGAVVVEAGSSGTGISRAGILGAKVDVKGMKGRRRRGVGPGVT